MSFYAICPSCRKAACISGLEGWDTVKPSEFDARVMLAASEHDKKCAKEYARKAD